jgi:hypothetical protein
MQVLLRKAFAAWRQLLLFSALAVAQSAAKQGLPAWQQPAAKAQPAMWGSAGALSGFPLLPFTIPTICPTASPAILAMPLQMALVQRPASADLLPPRVVGTEQSKQELRPQSHTPAREPAMQLPTSSGSRGCSAKAAVNTVAPHPQRQPGPMQPPPLSAESSEWTTVSTEAVAELVKQDERKPAPPAMAAAQPAAASASSKQSSGHQGSGSRTSCPARSKQPVLAPARPNHGHAASGSQASATTSKPLAQPPKQPPSPLSSAGPPAAGPAGQQVLWGMQETRRPPRGAKKLMLTGEMPERPA